MSTNHEEGCCDVAAVLGSLCELTGELTSCHDEVEGSAKEVEVAEQVISI